MTYSAQQHRLRETLENQGITNRLVLDVIEQTRRDLFVPEEMRSHAFANDALPIGLGQTISQPYIVALMTQALELKGDETVLEVGTGSGYQAAVLAQLCRQVVTIERHADLSRAAQKVLDELGFANIEFHVGDGTLGCAAHAPFDGILVTAAAPDVPEPLYAQLRYGGRLLVPVGDEHQQTLLSVERQEAGPVERELCACRFVKLIGAAGWRDG